jgi:cytochrome c peroxidase
MDLPLADAVARLAADDGYARAFADAYGGPPSEEALGFALASFVRTLVSGDSPYDRLGGDDATWDAALVTFLSALTDPQVLSDPRLRP